MSSHRILITGASGYLGGTLLARWKDAGLPPFDKLYALVRTDAQATAVQQYGAEPLRLDLEDEKAVRESIADKKITIVYFLIDAIKSQAQVFLIRALAQVKNATGSDVHFLHKSQIEHTPFDPFKTAVTTNCTVIEEADRYGVRSYIFAPCIVYGKGEGFGRIISRQTVDVVRAAQASKRMYKVDDGRPTWPVCHVIDNTTLYIRILHKILSGEDPGHGRNGYFLASPGSVAWDDLYTAMAAAMAKRNVISDDTVVSANEHILEQMAEALGCPPQFVSVFVGGLCTFTAEHGKELGWEPQFAPEHIIEYAEAEVNLILDNL
ncbi:hypothetical protein SLS53_009050 [Cytospora paraplurivora]|uniref:NAD-dependent epimerase/dehydratase domain-containing protein n=1 Tax=Cytospora paraplurivora TaxID=2898453 RepID=A0AAN9TWJ7_9PEZI